MIITSYKFKNSNHCTNLRNLRTKDKLCRIRMRAINDAIDAVMDLWKVSELPTLAFDLIEEDLDGSETVIYRMEKKNGCYTFHYVNHEYCARGCNYGCYFFTKENNVIFLEECDCPIAEY